ncbi:helix-turn-helix domain-containing protein [Janibacter sp. G56]|uniref:helix-turn-helix domain-containing protein n=1 Tax=Janibacter sp. G56 TaxID=3418717 RepID=UPI003D087CC7
MVSNPLGGISNNLGDYLREQRLSSKLSLRQLSEVAGISNPYLSQIERGVKRPSAEILQQIAKALHISAETLYVQAGLLDPIDHAATERPSTRDAIKADPALSSRQKSALIDIYESFVGAEAVRGEAQAPVAEIAETAPPTASSKPTGTRTRRTTSRTKGPQAKA